MKKMIIVLILSVGLNNAEANSVGIETYRHLMTAAYDNEHAAKQFYEETKRIGRDSPALYLGFKAVAEFMMCKHVINPFLKMAHFNKGKKLLAYAIAKDAANAELRFMRFCAQTQSPKILGYDDNLEEDKSFLMAYLKAGKRHRFHDEDLTLNIQQYLVENHICKQKEIEIL